MLVQEQLENLRNAAWSLLGSLQAMPEFLRRMRAISVPTEAASVRFVVLRQIIDATDLRYAALHLAAGGDWARGVATFDLDQTSPMPVELHSELVDYEGRLVEFVRRYLFDVSWGPEAVHDALRHDVPVSLPGVAEDWVYLKEPLEFVIPAGLTSTRDLELIANQLERVAADLRDKADYPENRALLAERAGIRRKAGESIDAPRELPPLTNDMVAKGRALVADRLGGSTSATQRQQHKRIKNCLEEAVSAGTQPIPRSPWNERTQKDRRDRSSNEASAARARLAVRDGVDADGPGAPGP